MLDALIDTKLRVNDATLLKLKNKITVLRQQINRTSDKATKIQLALEIQSLVEEQERILTDSERLLRT